MCGIDLLADSVPTSAIAIPPPPRNRWGRDSEFIEELLQIEEEVNCDIGAGHDLDPHLGKDLANAINCIDEHKLIALLESELSSVLSSDEIEAIANIVQVQVRHRVQRQPACFLPLGSNGCRLREQR